VKLRTFAATAGVLALCASAVCAPAAADENPIYRQLTTSGVRLVAGSSVQLPAPTLPDGLDAAAQRQAIGTITDAGHSFEALVRKSVLAPMVLKLSDVKTDSGASTGRRVDLWFVVYADLTRIADAEFLRQQFEAEAKPNTADNGLQLVALSPAELSSRNIVPATNERFFFGSIDLFDRVRLQTALRGYQTRAADSVLVAMAIDPRFDADRQFANSWRSVERDDSGRLQVGEPRPYDSAGGYVKATRLADPAGAVFVEYHLVFDELPEWFNGANLLRSKLPIVCQDGVRKFRRRVSGP
jgi:hypothetical protein